MSAAVQRHNETTYRSLRKGDLVEFYRGRYSHWGVFTGENDEIIHLAGEDDDGINGKIRPEHMFTISGKHFNKAKVCIDNFWSVCLDSKAVKNNTRDKDWRPYHPDEIVKNAKSKLCEEGYSLIWKNCEHFAKWCRYGKAQSDQVENVVTGVAVGMAAAFTVGLVHAISKWWSNSDETEEEKEKNKKQTY